MQLYCCTMKTKTLDTESTLVGVSVKVRVRVSVKVRVRVSVKVRVRVKVWVRLGL